MGIILAALAAAGDAGVRSMDQNIDQMHKMELNKQRMELETEKAKTIARFNSDLALEQEDKKREAMTERIGDAKDGIIESQMAKKWGAPDAAFDQAEAGQTDAPLTSEQKDVIEKAREGDVNALMTDPMTMLKAASLTGDVSTKETISLLLDQHRQEAAAAAEARKAARDESKDANEVERNRIRDRQVDVNADRVSAMFAKIGSAMGSDKTPAEVKATEWLIANKDNPDAMAAWDRQHTNKAKDIVTTAAEIFKSDPNAGSKKAKTVGQAYAEATELHELAGKTPLVDRPKPKDPAAPAGVPPGSTQIGTKGGKPVYQAPDGKRYIQQ